VQVTPYHQPPALPISGFPHSSHLPQNVNPWRSTVNPIGVMILTIDKSSINFAGRS